MSKIAGAYLDPLTFFSDQYTNADFRDKNFWEKEQVVWGKIEHNFSHQSISKVLRGSQKHKIQCNSKILITIDGLIGTEVPSRVTTNEEALIVISNHISSFLSLLNFGGKYFSSISEKQICHVGIDGNNMNQESGVGDQYSMVSMERALYRSPSFISNYRNFPWVLLRILKAAEMNGCYQLGKKIYDSLGLQSNEYLLALEAYRNYTVHQWNNSLVLGWTFIEILIRELWEKFILGHVVDDEEKRERRLNDKRTYTASVRIEVLYIDKVIDKTTYNELNDLRSLRNDLIHKGHFVQQQEVNGIFASIKSLINKLTGLEPKFNDPGWSRPAGFV